MKKTPIIFGIISATVSAVILFVFLIMLAPQIKTIADNVVKPMEDKVVHKIQLTDKEQISKNNRQIACLKDISITDKTNCFEKDKVVTPTPTPEAEMKEKETEKVLTPYEWGVKQVVNASFFIQFVYMLSFVALTIQVWQFLLINLYKADEFILNNRQTISEFAVNTPPVLGVLATLFAFAESTAASDSGLSVMAAFRSGVYDASSTTILGGLVYAIGMALNIFILRELKIREGVSNEK